MKSVESGQRYKSKNPDSKFGYSTIEVLDILTSETVTINFKWEKIKEDHGVIRTMRVETIQKEYNQI